MPAKVKGPTDHVVVVGAGLAGLSAALRLAGAGRKVTVVEREAVPGGRNGLLKKSGYSFDTGPSVLTMPDLISDALACVGEDIKDWLDLVPLKPLYRAFYHDGSQLDVHADTNQMQAEIAKSISSKEAEGYARYVEFVTKLYKYEMKDFIDRNIDSPLNLLKSKRAISSRSSPCSPHKTTDTGRGPLSRGLTRMSACFSSDVEADSDQEARSRPCFPGPLF